MKQRQLSQTDLWLSEIGLGGASIGNLYKEASFEDCYETIHKALISGICYFDTAPEYGHGLSERRMGDILREIKRDNFVLSTKVGDFLYARHDQLPAASKFIKPLPFHLRYDYSYDGIMRGFEDSLQRLGLNRIDIILVHDLDPIIHDEKKFPEHFKTYIDSGYSALEKLRSEGVIKAIGLGVKKWEVCEKALKYGDYECFMLQGNYTLLEQPAHAFLTHTCLAKRISVLLAGPYASGILATGAKKGAYFHHQAADEVILQKVKKIQTICDSFQIPMQAAAMQFPLLHPAIVSVVVGTSSPRLIDANINFAKIDIPMELWSALKEAGVGQ